MRRRLFYCDHHPIPLPPGHKFPIEKYALLRAMLAADGVYDLQPAPFADADDIELAHDRGIRAGDSGWHGGRARDAAHRLSVVASNWCGARWPRWAARWPRRAMRWRAGFGGNLAGGTHHAFRGEGSGFCVFNDLAVAILALRRDGLAARAAVIDLDVHQGDGTAAIFENDAAVLTLSMHGENNFPFRKQRSRHRYRAGRWHG